MYWAPRSAAETGLREQLERYATEHDLPQITWSMPHQDGHGAALRGQLARSDHPDDRARIVAGREWAEHLGLEAAPVPGAHKQSWAGLVGGVLVEIWAITEMETWDAAD
ncbi:hypothetical protein [Saccharopolyspora sp. SCSIO 74807]|uniref:hypothetical protein n=1 Tax=Saccharopolyspora sp. SCSIO 74807 TaxID=3118084 RepID=UPI0030D0B85A